MVRKSGKNEEGKWLKKLAIAKSSIISVNAYQEPDVLVVTAGESIDEVHRSRNRTRPRLWEQRTKEPCDVPRVRPQSERITRELLPNATTVV